MNKYVLGVDGGGTKTHCALFDLTGKKVDFLEWGTTNHERLKNGFDDLKIEIANLIKTILERNKISSENLETCVFGIAGDDTKEQHEKISEIIRNAGVKKFILCNDAFLGIMAGSPEGFGICAINGTGCCVVGINKNGRMMQIGGHGELSGDRVGGYFMGEDAISSVYSSLFRDSEETKLTDMLFSEYCINSKYDFMDVMVNKIENEEIKIADVSKFVFKAALENDKVSLSLLEKTGTEIAKSINGMIKELEFNDYDQINVVLAGSLNVRGEHPFMVDTIKKIVINRHSRKNILFEKLQKPPVVGALYKALTESGVKNVTLEHIASQL